VIEYARAAQRDLHDIAEYIDADLLSATGERAVRAAHLSSGAVTDRAAALIEID
jgi:hypothetical protein